MRYKSTFGVVNILLVISAALCLQGCSRKRPSINRALVIGISTNQGKDNPTLPNPAVDAENFGETLSSSANIPSKCLRVITENDEQLTRENILNELHHFAAQTNKNDVAWLMIEGYGIEINSENYFYTSDSTLNPKPAKETMISMQDILHALRGMQTKKLIITLAQHANALPSYDSEFSVPLSGSQWNAEWKIPSGVRSVVAFNFSGSEQSIPKFPLVNPFTYFLAKGLEGGAADQEGKIKVGNLLHYTQLGVASSILMYGGNIETCAWSVAATNKSEVLNTVLAKNLPPGSGGKSAVSLPSPPSARRKSDAAVLRGFELQTEIEQRLAENGSIRNAIKSHTLPQLIRTSFAPVKYQFYEAARLDPDSPMANYELGRIEMKMGDIDNARKHFEKAMKFAPKSSSPVWRLANLMQHEEKYQQAEVLYKKAMSLAPDNVMIKYDLSALYVATHELNEGKKLLNEIVQEHPNWDAPLDQLSYIVYVNGNAAQAIELLQRAYKLNPNNTDVIHKLAWNYCYKFKNYSKSENLYRKLIELFPEKALDRKEFAECLLLQGKTDEAKTQARKALDLGYPTNDPLFKKLKLN